MIDLLMTLYRLKDELRAGWVLRGVERPESVSDHSWGTALLCLLQGPAAGIDEQHAVAMALVHDVAEALTGDHPARLGPAGEPLPDAGKAEREHEAMVRLFPDAAEEPVRALWLEYEGRATPEALFVRDMNLVDMCLQALIYESQERCDRAADGLPRFRRLAEFLDTSRARLSTPHGRRLFDEILRRYEALGRS